MISTATQATATAPEYQAASLRAAGAAGRVSASSSGSTTTEAAR